MIKRVSNQHLIYFYVCAEQAKATPFVKISALVVLLWPPHKDGRRSENFSGLDTIITYNKQTRKKNKLLNFYAKSNRLKGRLHWISLLLIRLYLSTTLQQINEYLNWRFEGRGETSFLHISCSLYGLVVLVNTVLLKKMRPNVAWWFLSLVIKTEHEV